ncbi:MAG: SAM-dependent methyltransferase, partial [Clostridia bacterium]|nr:SAM-dependent methyltransferase [Clostridia bacterium]
PIQECLKFVKSGEFDVVMSNPPYKRVVDKSLISENEVEAISKHEVCLTLDELLKHSNKLLKFGGKFYIVYDAKRSAELIYKLKENHLEPKKMFFTSSAENKNPILILIEAVKGGKEGVNVLPTLITNDKNGDYIYTIQKLYKEKK